MSLAHISKRKKRDEEIVWAQCSAVVFCLFNFHTRTSHILPSNRFDDLHAEQAPVQ